MAKNRMDVLELLRKEAEEADIDFLREGLLVLVQAVMEAEVAAKTGAERGERSPERMPQRLPGPAMGYASGDARSAHPEGAGGQLLPFVARTSQAQ